jgi:hypothetical protein
MIAVVPPDRRNAMRSNRWSSTGIGGACSMIIDNGRGSGQIAVFGPRPGCSAARISIPGIVQRPAPWCGATTIVTSRALKSP